MAGVAAAIVVFHPDAARLLALVDTAGAEVGRLYLFLNSAIPPDLRSRLEARPDTTLIEAQRNLGIGTGLNMAALAAAWQGFASVVFFDQDSQPRPGTITALHAAQQALVAQGREPAVVAPLMVAEAGRDSKPPRYRFRAEDAGRGGLRAADFIPTSGSLVSVETLRKVGFFRADYFIDGIDLEWSFRAWSRGFSCWVLTSCPMPHSVGTGVIEWPRLRFRMPRQRPFRMYCLVRNLLYGLRLRHIPWAWKGRHLAYLPVQLLAYALHHRFDGGVLRLLLAGVTDGLRGRLGEPRGLPERVASPEPHGGRD